MSYPAQAPGIRRFGAFEIDLQSGEVRKNGMRLRLSGQAFQVLAVLVERPGALVTREELHSKLWAADTFVDFDHGLNNAVARIREVLDDSSDTPRYIETVPRRGYRFIAPLTNVGPATVPAPETARPDIGVPAVPPAAKKSPSILPRVLLAAAILLGVIAVAFVLHRNTGAKPASTPAITSLAVLPLKNLSGDPAQEYLADGMTEELIGRLSQIRDLRVISRTSVVRFKDTQLSAPEIAKMLGVDALVEGSVIREGSRIRVHAQLIRASTDDHFWSEAYDRELQDVLSLESEVAQSIARKVEVTISGKERERLTAARSVSPEVYESYLKGWFTLNNSNYRRAGIEESIRYFQDAIKKDPAFAPAYVGLANAYRQLGAGFVGVPNSETRPKVMSAAQKALELNPELAEAHARLADLYQQTFRWSDAQAEYKRALELKPNDAATHRIFAYWLVAQGRSEEAVAWCRRARELDPLGTSSYSLGSILFYSRRYDEAVHELRSALAVRPDDGVVLWYLGFALMAKGQPEEAIPVLEKAVSVSDRSPAVVGTLVRAYAHAGRRAVALRLLAELKKRRQAGYVTAYAFVNAYLGLDDYEETFAWLEEAYKEQSNGLQFLKVHPFYDPIREDPRFKDLVRRVGLN
jgi:TolB-like protein/DNA-binding winged helix-turn-helix (wHTH) protein/Flp pilus assembly protein TadD